MTKPMHLESRAVKRCGHLHCRLSKSSMVGSVFECSSSSNSSTQISEVAAVGSKAEAKATREVPDHALDLVTVIFA